MNDPNIIKEIMNYDIDIYRQPLNKPYKTREQLLSNIGFCFFGACEYCKICNYLKNCRLYKWYGCKIMKLCPICDNELKAK